jgi:hypothetical protein
LSQGFAKDAAVAYSLRALGSYNEPVVRVRREPHDTDDTINDEKNFTASQVSVGELENWVNGKLETEKPADVNLERAISITITHSAINSGNSITLKFVQQSFFNSKPRYYTEDNVYELFYFVSDGNVNTQKWYIRLSGGGGSDNRLHTSATNLEASDLVNLSISDWDGDNGTLSAYSATATTPASAAFSLRKVNSAYGIPVTKISSANIFPTSLTTTGQIILTSDGSNSGFNIRDFQNNSPTSHSSTINGNSWTVEATHSGSAVAFAKSVRIFGLETNKQYVVKGEARMVTDTTASGDSFFRVDISDANAGDEDKVSMSPTSFTPFLIDVGYTADANNAFVDFTVSTNVATTGTIKAEFRNVELSYCKSQRRQ